jgi:hypothetical protein
LYWTTFTGSQVPEQKEVQYLTTDPLLFATLIKRYEKVNNPQAAARLKPFVAGEQWNKVLSTTSELFQKSVNSY